MVSRSNTIRRWGPRFAALVPLALAGVVLAGPTAALASPVPGSGITSPVGGGPGGPAVSATATVTVAKKSPYQVPGAYVVKPGNTLAWIAGKAYGDQSLWPALWWVNRHQVHNPNAIVVGERLRLSSWHPQRAWLVRAAMAAIPPPPLPVTTTAQPNAPPAGSSAGYVASAPVYSSSLGGGWTALRQCESGGNYADNTGNGFYGAYQFDLGTWQSVGGTGLPSNASPGEQDRLAQKLYSERGSAPWPQCGRYLG